MIQIDANECTTQWQSPIDINSPFVHEEFSIDFFFGKQDGAIMYTNGYNLKIDGDFGGFRWRNSYFSSTEINFKHPSEHHIDGREYPLEMQLHHVDQWGNQAFVAAFFEISSEGSFLNNIGFGNPLLREADVGTLYRIKDTVDINELFEEPETYFLYEGSSTSTPCHHNVTWIMLTDTYKISESQVENFPLDLVDKHRDIQPKNDRTIYSNFNLSEAEEEVKKEEEESDGDVEQHRNQVQSTATGRSYKPVNDDFIVEEPGKYQDIYPEGETPYNPQGESPHNSEEPKSFLQF